MSLCSIACIFARLNLWPQLFAVDIDVKRTAHNTKLEVGGQPRGQRRFERRFGLARACERDARLVRERDARVARRGVNRDRGRLGNRLQVDAGQLHAGQIPAIDIKAVRTKRDKTV